MPRNRREWSDIRAEVRRLLRETDETNPYWGNALLLDLANQSLDLRALDMAIANEGWVTDTVTADIVAGQREYTLPEGIGRLKRVLIVRDDGSGSLEVPLTRHERYSEPVWHSTGALLFGGEFPTARLEGELLILEPKPRVAVTAGLHLQFEAMPPRLTGDTDKLPLRFPDVLETLLVYDIACGALSVEASQENVSTRLSEPQVNHLQSMRRQYERRFLEFIDVRLDAPLATLPHYMGD